MFYTVRYAHLYNLPNVKTGDIIRSGDKVGVMGNTGKSTATHLHIDCVEGVVPNVWRLRDMENNDIVADPKQLNYFIDDNLLKAPIAITSYYCDPFYGKIHKAYDLVAKDRAHFIIYWNRSMTGKVLSKGQDNGYGYFIHITYEA